jgi:hypothetical protein
MRGASVIFDLTRAISSLEIRATPGLQKDLHMSDQDFSMALTVTLM